MSIILTIANKGNSFVVGAIKSIPFFGNNKSIKLIGGEKPILNASENSQSVGINPIGKKHLKTPSAGKGKIRSLGGL